MLDLSCHTGPFTCLRKHHFLVILSLSDCKVQKCSLYFPSTGDGDQTLLTADTWSGKSQNKHREGGGGRSGKCKQTRENAGYDICKQNSFAKYLYRRKTGRKY